MTLAADSRLAQLDYTNDQIWELRIGSGEPAALVLQTSYGLRARSMRVFPQFVESHQLVANPRDFETAPVITHFAPNYMRLTFEPFLGIDVVLEYWVPDSHAVAGRVLVKNTSELDRKVRFELAAILTPNDEGRQMIPRKKEATNVLQGATEDLAPVLFITGGAENAASPYPHLSHELELAPDAHRRFTWVLATLNDDELSFRHARLTAARNWEAEISRIEHLAEQLPQIHTGDPNWDATLGFSQKAALNLLYSPTQQLPQQSFVSTRLPDQGYSAQGSGTEYNHLWSGQTPQESWYISQFLLPGQPEAAKGILLNFLQTQKENGFIDHKIGLAGQRSNMIAAPFLVSMAWQIYRYTEDKTFLEEVFRPLLWYIQTWFWSEHDEDGDGIPEWRNLLQTGYDENPAFSPWQTWSEGIDIGLVESPDLSTYLYREITLLKKIATLVGKTEPILSLEALADNQKSAVLNSWNMHRATFQYWDRDNHLTTKGETLKTRTGSGEILLDLIFEVPTRLQIVLETKDLTRPNVEISIHGTLPNEQARVETIPSASLNWIDGICRYTLPQLYTEIELVHITGLPADGRAAIKIVDLYQEDHTLLIPIWGGIPKPKQVKSIIKRKLKKPGFYGKPHGIPAIPKPATKQAEDSGMQVWLPWNTMILEGLLDYGHTAEAAELFSNFMEGIIGNLKQDPNFRAYYRADKIGSVGQRNHIIGLPSTGLFLEILGVRPISPWKIAIQHKNPFPWPVTVEYRGTKITSAAEKVDIQFLDGETISVSEEIPCMVENTSQLTEEQP